MEAKQNTLLDDHRNMLMVSKQLSEFQLTNLKSWGHIVFNDIDKIKIEYNFINTKDEFYAGKVIFDFTFKEGKEPDEHRRKKALSDLYAWVKVLFWVDTEVIFKKKGKKWT